MNAVVNLREKYKNIHEKPSTEQLRTKFRKNFLITLQDARRRSIDARRFSSSSATDHKICSNGDLRKILMDSRALLELISADEVDEIIREVETEIGFESTGMLNLYDAEIQAIVDNLLTTCSICDQNSTSIICTSCANEHFTESL